MEHIEEFQKLNIRVKNNPEEHKIDVFIGTLKDNIQHDVHLCEPDSLEKAFRLARKMESIGLVNTYSPMDSLILWHFPEQFIVPPFAIIT